MDEQKYAITCLITAVILKGSVPTWLIWMLLICSILMITVFRDNDKEKGTSQKDAPNKTN